MGGESENKITKIGITPEECQTGQKSTEREKEGEKEKGDWKEMINTKKRKREGNGEEEICNKKEKIESNSEDKVEQEKTKCKESKPKTVEKGTDKMKTWWRNMTNKGSLEKTDLKAPLRKIQKKENSGNISKRGKVKSKQGDRVPLKKITSYFKKTTRKVDSGFGAKIGFNCSEVVVGVEQIARARTIQIDGGTAANVQLACIEVGAGVEQKQGAVFNGLEENERGLHIMGGGRYQIAGPGGGGGKDGSDQLNDNESEQLSIKTENHLSMIVVVANVPPSTEEDFILINRN